MDAFDEPAERISPPLRGNLPLHPTLRCPVCQASLQVLEQIAFRSGRADTTTLSGWFFEGWQEMGERMQAIDTYRCARCGRLEMYDHDFSLPKR